MKVTVISSYYPPDFIGGAEIYAYRLTKEISKLDVHCEVITSTKGRRKVKDEEGVKVYRITKPLPLNRIFLHLLGYNFNPSSMGIKKILEKTNPDIIHMHNISGTIMMYPLLRFLKNSVIQHLHDYWPICYRGTLYNMRENKKCDEDCIGCCFRSGLKSMGRINLTVRKRILPLFESKITLFISPSSYLRNEIISKGFTTPDKILHIPLGIDLSEFKPSIKEIDNSNNRTIVFIGRLVGYKNPSFIVRIMPRLLKEVDCTYKVIGGGPEAENITILAKKLGVEKHVEVLGKVPTHVLINNLSNADVFVIPSIWPENSPVTIYESLACSTPAFVSNRGGPKELIDEGKSGFSLDPSNEDEWSEAILKVLTDENLRIKMSVEARKKAEREYDIKQNAKKILGIYERLAKG